MTGVDGVLAASERLAAAIATRDLATLRALFAPGFLHRTHGGDASNAERFLAGVAGIPGEIQFVRIEQVTLDPTPAGVLVTGIQHARVVIDGATVDDRRRFVDWFVSIGGAWRIRMAVDLPDPVR